MDQHHHPHSIQPPQQQPQFISTTDAPPSFTGFIPPQSAPPPSHPSYSEMITAAIVWDNTQGKGGSSKRAIAKYIDRVYTNLPPNHSSLLTHYLKELKHNGYLVMVKNSYQLASVLANSSTGEGVPANPAPSHTGSAPPPDLNTSEQQQQQSFGSVDPAPKRRPGRPPRTRSDPIQPPGQENGVGGAHLASTKKRGRPPKQQVIRPHTSQMDHQIMMEQAETPLMQPMIDGLEVQKRRPGRPPKLTPVVPARTLAQTQLNGPDQVTESGAVVVKRKRGRPAWKNVGGDAQQGVVVAGSSSGGGGGKRRGRPKRSGVGAYTGAVGKRPRGRPPRAGGGGGALVVVGRRPGRPPKVSGLPKLRRLSATGKPMGRPRKNAVSPNQVSEQMANEELTKKIDLMQSKIRDAVDVLRSYIPHENAPWMALQQLEELAAPIVTAPQTAPPVMTTSMTTLAPTPVNMSAPMPVNMSAPMPVNMNAPMPVNMSAPMPVNMNVPPPMGTTSAPPSDSESAPYMNLPGPFSVNLPQMTVSAPFQVPSNFVNPQRMSWMPSNGAQS